ncbi:hypothetical protein [Microbacterium aquimaris]|uniref:Uncharacterized protein n=1 Tax=Microbacterium aquimaris TaxID=459816 RepID=A0ABU5N5E0_9MICO|nr:hypothetical protein [Microbacterium aquimaris]MDZ8161291.1 hypothetical protein [Microbacterium aquimaris]
MPDSIETLTFAATVSRSIADVAMLIAVPSAIVLAVLLALDNADLLIVPLAGLTVSVLLAAVGLGAQYVQPLIDVLIVTAAAAGVGTGVRLLLERRARRSRSDEHDEEGPEVGGRQLS